MSNYTIIDLRPMSSPCLDGKGGVFGMLPTGVQHVHTPCVWKNGAPQPIEEAPQARSMRGVNRNGDLLLDIGDRENTSHVLYRDGITITLPFMPIRMNDSCQIVGRSVGENPTYLLWENESIQELPHGFSPACINNQGVLAGMIDAGIAIWRDGVLTPIDVEGQHVTVDDINDAGMVLVSGSLDADYMATFTCIWTPDQVTTIELPYAGNFQDGFLNSYGDVAGDYWIDVGPPYVYEESVFAWQNGTSEDINAATLHHLLFSYVLGFDDLGQLLMGTLGGDCYLLLHGVQPQPEWKRPEVSPAFILHRDFEKIRSLTWMGMPGASRIQHFLRKLLKQEEVTNAIDPSRVRIGAREKDAVLIVDAEGVTMTDMGFLPWDWIDNVHAFEIERKAALTIWWRTDTAEFHNRFPDTQARAMLFEDALLGGPVINGATNYTPLPDVYRAIEAYAKRHVTPRNTDETE